MRMCDSELSGVDGWFKSSASDPNDTGCVEVDFSKPGVVGLRDSEHAEGGAFVVTSAEWCRFLTYA